MPALSLPQLLTSPYIHLGEHLDTPGLPFQKAVWREAPAAATMHLPRGVDPGTGRVLEEVGPFLGDGRTVPGRAKDIPVRGKCQSPLCPRTWFGEALARLWRGFGEALARRTKESLTLTATRPLLFLCQVPPRLSSESNGFRCVDLVTPRIGTANRMFNKASALLVVIEVLPSEYLRRRC